MAVDLPGHGQTGHWQGHHRFRDNAADVAAFIRAAGLDRADLQVVGHSWGAMTAAALPAAGFRPATLVLLDPPAVPHAFMAAQAADPSRATLPRTSTRRSPRSVPPNPAWADGDVRAKAEALTQLDEAAARAVFLDNGDWDGGLADLADPAAAGIPILARPRRPCDRRLHRGRGPAGVRGRIGADHVITIAGRAPFARSGPTRPRRPRRCSGRWR